MMPDGLWIGPSRSSPTSRTETPVAALFAWERELTELLLEHERLEAA
jgi:hypothetical protein